MSAPVYLKKAARALGIYRPARNIYRRFNAEVRSQRVADLRLYGQFIRPADLVFDIGANLGQKSEIFLGLGARVVALEPNPNCAPLLQRDFPELTLLQQAVGREAGKGSLTFANTISTASMRQDWHGLQYRDGELQEVDVPITTLDKLIAEYGVPKFCKIDVEGFELEVIRGLSQPIPVITLEYHVNDRKSILDCLHVLNELAPIEINAIAMNGTELLVPRWMDIERFHGWLGRGDIPHAGDVFVRI